MKPDALILITDFFASADQRFYDLTAHEKTLAFTRAFSGVDLLIPVLPVIERTVRDRAIVDSLTKNPSKETCCHLMDRFGLERRIIAKIFVKKSALLLSQHRKKLVADAAEKEAGKKEDL